MGRVYDHIDDRLASFLEVQPVFFVATAPLDADGLVNCSPKGNRGEFKVIGPNQVAYLDQTGSGVETIAHLGENGRMVIMFCAFDGPPRIVRLHCRGEALVKGDERFSAAAAVFERGGDIGPRAVIASTVTRVSDSCGYGVPLMDFRAQRPTMDEWAARKGPDGIPEYWAAKNRTSLDGLPGLRDPDGARNR